MTPTPWALAVEAMRASPTVACQNHSISSRYCSACVALSDEAALRAALTNAAGRVGG